MGELPVLSLDTMDNWLPVSDGYGEQRAAFMLPPWTRLGLVSPSQPESEDIRAEEREWPGQWLVAAQWRNAALPHLDTHNTAGLHAASVGDNATDNI